MTRFRLECAGWAGCLEGPRIQTLQEAELSGWSDLRPTAGGRITATHLGLCPACQGYEKDEGADLAKTARERIRPPNTTPDPLPLRLKAPAGDTIPGEEARP